MSAARWVEEGLSNNFAHVDALVPRGYAAYGRLFQPASGEDKRRVRWSEVEAWAGSVAHPLMAFEGISAPKPGYGAGARPWLQEPMEDQMDEQDARALAVLLSDFTRTPQHCYFGIWDGFGQYSPGAMTLLTTSGGILQTPPPDVIAAQRLDGVRREYLLYEGALTAIGSFFNHFWSHPPNIWWPEDRSWCVATDIDLNTTYVGGSEACISANNRWKPLPRRLTLLSTGQPTRSTWVKSLHNCYGGALCTDTAVAPTHLNCHCEEHSDLASSSS